MGTSKKAHKTKLKKNFLTTKYFCFLIGFCLIIISIILWKSQESNDLSKLYSQTELKAKYYSSEAEVRFNRIYNALDIIVHKMPAYEETDIDQWEKDSVFYIDSFKGIENIIWADEALQIRRIASLQDNESYINKRANEVFDDPSNYKLWFSVYDGTELSGFIVGVIDINEFISPVISDIENGYMLQIREEDRIIYSSENWEISGEEVIFNGKIILQNTKVWDLSISPTEELVNSEIARSVRTLLFSLLLSLMMTASIFFAQNAYAKSKLLQYHQKHLKTIVSDRTKALKKSNDILAEKIKEIKSLSKGLEKMVEERTRELRDAQEKLIRKEKLAVLGQLAGGVSHELRNPLGVIKNIAYFLNMVIEKSEPDIKKTLKILDEEIKTAERIISSMLDFAHLGDPIKKKIDIVSILKKIISDNTVPDNITVLEKFSKTLPKTPIDPVQARQIFSNIINNAIQAMPDGGKLTIKSNMPGPHQVEISISDTGIGIPQENMKKLFEPLFTTKARGIGLGLPLTRSMVKANGGKIEVKSTKGKGTTFKVILPLVKEVK